MSSKNTDTTHVQVAIIGTGFSGLGAGIRLKQEGIEDFILLDKAETVGGTWRDNSYPGCACDVESHLYSFSFAPKPDWSRLYAPYHEIRDYLEGCARDHGLTGHLRMGCSVGDVRWHEDEQRWHLQTSQGAVVARFVLAATGPLSEPSIPELPGLERFEGASFHSAQWDHSQDLTGRKVAVIGTGASAIQFVPEVQKQAAQLSLFQRTAPWVMPRNDRAISRRELWVYRNVPGAQRAARKAIYLRREAMLVGFRHPRVMAMIQKVAEAHLATQIPDEALRTKLTPHFAMGCKRVLLSDVYYPALTQPNVEVITDGIAEILPRGIRTQDGREVEADTILFGTGFHVSDTRTAANIHGRYGQSLSDAWQGSPKAYIGSMVSGFPNLFLALGPNSGLGHSSVVMMAEMQIEHMLRCLHHLRARDMASIEVQAEAQARFVADVEEDVSQTVWSVGGCKSWYLDETGRNSTLWPNSIPAFERASRFRAADHLVSPATRAAVRATA